MTQITLFTKSDCCLCDAAAFILRKVRHDQPFDLDLVDISTSAGEPWREQYAEHIPVVHMNGREVFRHRIDERDLRRLLLNASAP